MPSETVVAAVVISSAQDTLLRAYLAAASDADARRQAERLIRHEAEPIIHSVLQRCSHRFRQDSDVQDAYGETVLLLLSRLQAMRSAERVPRGDRTTIRNFHGYVKVTARNAWCRRAQLQLRRDSHTATEPTSPIQEGAALLDNLPDRTDIARDACHRATLRHLWSEILTLPLPQRVALLLNFRVGDEFDALPLITLLGIATQADVANAIELSLAEYTSLGDQLPLNDHTIAARLGVTRRQVINFRLAARRRLERFLNRL